MIYIAYSPDGVGCFLQVGTFTDLQLAIAATPTGGHVEQITESGSIRIYP